MILTKRLLQDQCSVRFIGSVTDSLVTSAGVPLATSVTGVSWVPGDLGIAFVVNDARDDTYDITGWTELIASNTLANREYAVWTRTMQSGDTTFASTNLGNGVDTTIAIITFWRYASVTAGDCASFYQNAGAASYPNPPASAVSNIKPTDAVLVFGMHDDNLTVITGVPTGFTQINIVSLADCDAAAAYRKGVYGSIDPDAFTGTGATDGSQGTHTLVLRRI